MNTNKKGANNERRSRKLLEAAGYQCMRSGGSLGMWDVIGIGSTDAVLCQVKSNEWPRSVEMETLKNFVCPKNFRKLVHRWRDRQRLPDVREIA